MKTDSLDEIAKKISDEIDQRYHNSTIEQYARKQSLYFGTLIAKHTPSRYLNNKKTLDFGCGGGEMLYLFSKIYKKSHFIGMDLNKDKISTAQKYYTRSNVQYRCEDISVDKTYYDVTITSNTLEHFHNPLEWVAKLAYKCDTLILLLPYMESCLFDNKRSGCVIGENTVYNGHVTRFHKYSFPKYLNGYHKKVMSKIIKSDRHFWPGHQILVVYQKDEKLFKLTKQEMTVKQIIKSKLKQFLYKILIKSGIKKHTI